MRTTNKKQSEILISLCVVFSCLVSKSSSQSQNADDVTYQDLKDLGASCEPKDTCFNVSIEPYDPTDRNCDCDALCIEYDTCCVDSPYRKYNTSLKSRIKRQACVTVHGHSVSFFMVSECHPKWTGNPGVLKKCHDYDMGDPYTIIPASDRRNGVTYKNVFCAICTGVEPSSLTVWTMNVIKTSPQNYSGENFVGNLTYDEGSKLWGQWETFNFAKYFSTIQFVVNIPKERLLRSCTTDLIQECDHAWTDKATSQKCHSYMAPIYAAKRRNLMARRYRNVHCGICNFAASAYQRNICTLRRTVDSSPNKDFERRVNGDNHQDDLYRLIDSARNRDHRYEVDAWKHREDDRFRIGDTERNRKRHRFRDDDRSKISPNERRGLPVFSFTLLLDVNSIDGNHVGEKINKCKSGESYDPFFKKCRNLVCGIPGFVLKADKCSMA